MASFLDLLLSVSQAMQSSVNGGKRIVEALWDFADCPGPGPQSDLQAIDYSHGQPTIIM